MKKVLGLFFAAAMMFSIVFISEALSSNSPFSAQAQQTSVRRTRPVRGVVSGAKYIYRKGKNGVVYAYRKTAQGTVYVGKKTYQGGKFVGKKSYQGGKYVGKKTVKGTRKVVSRTKKVIVN